MWQRKPTVLCRTDIRCESLPLDPCNLMLHQAADRIASGIGRRNFGGGDNFKIGDWHEVPDFQFTLAHNGQGRSLNAANKLRSQSCIIDGEAVSCGDDGFASFDRIRYRRHDADVFSGPST